MRSHLLGPERRGSCGGCEPAQVGTTRQDSKLSSAGADSRSRVIVLDLIQALRYTIPRFQTMLATFSLLFSCGLSSTSAVESRR
jgi:hypothetical protein